jgi:hypothetical protein
MYHPASTTVSPPDHATLRLRGAVLMSRRPRETARAHGRRPVSSGTPAAVGLAWADFNRHFPDRPSVHRVPGGDSGKPRLVATTLLTDRGRVPLVPLGDGNWVAAEALKSDRNRAAVRFIRWVLHAPTPNLLLPLGSKCKFERTVHEQSPSSGKSGIKPGWRDVATVRRGNLNARPHWICLVHKCGRSRK